MRNLLLCFVVIIIVYENIFAISSLDIKVSNSQSGYFLYVETNLSHYASGDTVFFNASINSVIPNGSLQINYYHLSDKISEQTIQLNQTSTVNWNWLPPMLNHQGYLAEIILMEGNQTLDTESIAIDVSSDWNYYPRYGFLSNYPQLSSDSIKAVIETLNRFHINGIQFYDWQYKHNMPLKGTPDNPAPYWNDIANRVMYFSTVKSYIDETHKHNMKAMAYNLIYGAYSNAYQDGVDLDAWGLYKDSQHQNRFMYTLPSGWASNLYFMDPSNMSWQAYLINQEKLMFEALPFDGWHVDQVGDNGLMYNYQGKQVSVGDTFYGFLKAAKDSLNVDIVMNAVNQYGQSGIAVSPVDFLYSEVWDPNNSFTDLINIISRNNFLSSNKLKTVLAAYVNYDLANNHGYFNTPGVLLLDAVIFASGASHLELGEHMLCKEYFPNDNLKMSDELKNKLTNYYDFFVAYENLLRDSVTIKKANITSTSNIAISTLPQQGAVWSFLGDKDNFQIIHLINFVKANLLAWRDPNGTQVEPDTIYNLPLTFAVASKVSKIWIASPDFENVIPINISFIQNNGSVSFTVPKLNYWDIVVIEYSSGSTSIKDDKNQNSNPGKYSLEQNYPNPFNPQTIIPFKMKDFGKVQFTFYNILGSKVFDKTIYGNEGDNKFEFNALNLESGVYFYQMKTRNFTDTKKLILLK